MSGASPSGSAKSHTLPTGRSPRTALLTRPQPSAMGSCSAVVADQPPNHDQDDRGTTLGDLLFGNKAKAPVSEAVWVGLVQLIAAGDQRALHALYAQTHRIVFSLIMRIVSNRETAEELTVDVFYDVWRRASAYDPAGGSVTGWILNQARSR